MSGLIILIILFGLPLMLKGRFVRQITWPLTILFAVLLIASPFVYYGIVKTKPVLSKATAERIDHDNRQMMRDMINEDVAKYKDHIVATKQFNVNVPEIHIFGDTEDANVYYYVESTEALTDTIEVTLYKRPYVINGVTIGQTLKTPKVQFKQHKLQFIGHTPPSQDIYQVRTFSKSSAIDSLERKDAYGISAYVAYIRVPQKLRVYDAQGYRFQQGGSLDDIY